MAKTEKKQEDPQKVQSAEDPQKEQSAEDPQKEKPTHLKTYLMQGMMACTIELLTGLPQLPSIHISFEGGQITGYGVTPARYTTDSQGLQKLIEASPLFKCGRITVIDHGPIFTPKPKEPN